MANALSRILCTGLLIFITFGSLVVAHATIVFGDLSAEPAIPEAGEPFTLVMTMYDPTDVPVEDAYVLAEFSQGDTVIESRFEEASPGVYETDITLPDEGEYILTLRDQTFRQEEATAQLDLQLASAELFPEGTGNFLFPPTVTSSNSLTTWLIWLIALPVVVGVIVTILVLRNPRKTEVD